MSAPNGPPPTGTPPAPATAGREMDIEVGRRVMGYRHDLRAPHCWRDERDELFFTMPPFSQDIRDAWRVVEKMRSLGAKLMLEQCSSDEYEYDDDTPTRTLIAYEDQWLALFQDEITRGKGSANAPAEAICIAAIAAIQSLHPVGR